MIIKKLTHINFKDGKSHHLVNLCEENEHLLKIRECWDNKSHLFIKDNSLVRGSPGFWDYPNIDNKFKESWSTVLRLKALNNFRNFLRYEGDNKTMPLLLSSVFFNCHTEATINFLVKAVGGNKNLQKRHPIHFCYDLLTGWIPEVAIGALDIEKCGCDADYKFAAKGGIDSSEDFLLSGCPLELVCDFTGKVKRESLLNFRYNKLNSLIKNGGYLLILLSKSFEYYLYDMNKYSELLNIEYKDEIIPWSREGKKTRGYEMSGDFNSLKLKDLTLENLNKSFNDIKLKEAKKISEQELKI